MVFKKILTSLLLTFLAELTSLADVTDTVLVIREVEVQGSRLNFVSIGSTIQHIDSSIITNYQLASVGEMLAQQSALSIKQYGPGGLANVSIRGGDDHHTSVIWNGLNIQSPMNGGVNLSSLPSCFIDQTYIQHGGSSTLFGSGTTTGSIHLQENLSFNSGFQGEIGTYAASAHNYMNNAKFRYGGKNYAGNIKYFFQNNKNDFFFRNTQKTNDPVERLEHGSYKQYGFAQSNKYRLTNNTWIGSHIWYLYLDKQIPPKMSSGGTSEATQQDKNLLYSVFYKRSGELISIKVLSGGIYNGVPYSDPQNNIYNDNHSFSYLNTLEITSQQLKGLNYGFIIEQKTDKGSSYSFEKTAIRNVWSGIFSLNYSISILKIQASARQEFVDGKSIPQTASLGSNISLPHNISINLLGSRNYSLPTFNDLYWKRDAFSAGNPDLVPEDAWTADFGAEFKQQNSQRTLTIKINSFYTYINQWIKWLPDQDGIWTPKNIQEGESKGIESSLSYIETMGSAKIRIQTHYNYTHAVAKKSIQSEIQTNTQMWYVPRHNMSFVSELFYAWFSIMYTQNILGTRTYDNDIGEFPPVTIGNINFIASIPFKEYQLQLIAKADNIWNSEYQYIQGYAMPLRQYSIGIKLLLH